VIAIVGALKSFQGSVIGMYNYILTEIVTAIAG
jgi:hypothetical protein